MRSVGIYQQQFAFTVSTSHRCCLSRKKDGRKDKIKKDGDQGSCGILIFPEDGRGHWHHLRKLEGFSDNVGEGLQVNMLNCTTSCVVYTVAYDLIPHPLQMPNCCKHSHAGDRTFVRWKRSCLTHHEQLSCPISRLHDRDDSAHRLVRVGMFWSVDYVSKRIRWWRPRNKSYVDTVQMSQCSGVWNSVERSKRTRVTGLLAAAICG